MVVARKMTDKSDKLSSIISKFDYGQDLKKRKLLKKIKKNRKTIGQGLFLRYVELTHVEIHKGKQLTFKDECN